MGGLAGAAGSIGSAAIAANAQQAMQDQLVDNYWRQVQRQAHRDRVNYYWRRQDYQNAWNKNLAEMRQARYKSLTEQEKARLTAKQAYEKVQDVLRGPSTDVYGGLRKYVPGQGFQYSMAPDILKMFRDSLGNVRRGIDFGNRVQQEELPKALAAYAGRKQYTPAELYQIYGEDARLADWRARQEAGNRLGLQSVRGGNRSNWANKVQEYLAEDSRDRRLRMNEARRASIGDALNFNRQSDDNAFSRLSSVLGMAQSGREGEKYGEFADTKASNPTGIESALAAAISNIGPQTDAYQSMAATWQNTVPPMNEVYTIKRPGEMEARPNLTV